ncbi:carbon starvation CstA family protein [Planctomicrobium piriforme]|uniref:Carbon starvation protein n=1 Tax=Planctomicrobium piriforme TaxID=1576369 RepID=A0A1I3NG94_9PLAN|nr:carbon starvation CstA family protein [Planctomicrobium piriforme]SFJ07980.1 carbon starvation protein [Planctomicrobium piriforme]
MMVAVVLISAAVLLTAYRTYGSLLVKLLRLNPHATTPAYTLRDDVDYSPLNRGPLLNQHFSAIAAAGPIVGPILAGAAFGWLPAMLWILIGSIFIGGVHDFTALIASVRHQGKSIAEVVRENMSQRAFILFLTFIWLALVYIIVAFTDITAASFIGQQELESGEIVTGAGIASSSLMYLALPIMMGLLMRYAGLSNMWATIIFLPLIGVAIYAGQQFPFDVAAIIKSFSPEMTEAQASGAAHVTWDVALLLYCALASVAPLWLLLQPRGELGGYFLFIALGAGAIGLIAGGRPVELPAFSGWTSLKGDTLAPMLFITIACGACSGFHSLIASGTTSKQLRSEMDAKPVGYGSMLLEAMVAIVSLCCVMALAPDHALVKNPQPNFIYALGIGSFLEAINIPPAIGVSFALMAFSTFVYDTLDVCTRLGRFIIQELTGIQGSAGRWLGTIVTTGAPMFFVFQATTDATGRRIPVWRTFWELFGASNQLLAAITLLGVTVWLWRTRQAVWVWFVTGIPMVLMSVMSIWALICIILKHFKGGITANPVPWIAILLVALAAMMLVEGIIVIFGRRPIGPQSPLPEPA